MKRTVTLALTLALGAALGAFGYHFYLSQNPLAARPYVAATLSTADQEADRETGRAYVHMVATAIEVGRIDSPEARPPTDCSSGYQFGLDVPANSRITSCTVTLEPDGKATVTAITRSGESASLGPY